ncbi:uncharacterized protein [Nicotiana tomentosiformis]|uniref:uncharacterized protein n=1 Tax=Nicotiana tomentosiformis TaxID=4098 RepID=UPI00388C38C6
MKSFIVKTYERLDAHAVAIKELGIGLHNLEAQMGQIATILSERILGTLPADTEKNPKEMVNVITLRSGQVLKDPTPIQKKAAHEKESGNELKIEDGKKEETSRREDTNAESKHIPALPIPHKLYREKLDNLRQILEGDPFKEEEVRRDLSDQALRALKLEKEIGEIRSVPISLQLADQTTITPNGIVEDVLVRVDKFIFHVDFILETHARVDEETVTFEMNVAIGVKKEKPAASVEWKNLPCVFAKRNNSFIQSWK